MKINIFRKGVVLFAILLLVAALLMVAGCGSKSVQLSDKQLKGVTSTMHISLPFEVKPESAEPKAMGNGATVAAFSGQDSDFEVTVSSLHIDKDLFKASTKQEYKADLNDQAKKIYDRYKKNFSATGQPLADTAINGLPAKEAVLDRTSKEIKLKMRFLCFYKGEELWTITIAYRADNEDFDKAAEAMIKSISF